MLKTKYLAIVAATIAALTLNHNLRAANDTITGGSKTNRFYTTVNNGTATLAAGQRAYGNSITNELIRINVKNFTLNISGTIEGGKHGVTGEGVAAIHNEGVIRGLDGSGLNFDYLAGDTAYTVAVNNSGLIEGNTSASNSAADADGDAIDIDHAAVITNSGTIRTVRSNRSADAISIGGGSVTNSGLISAANNNSAGSGAYGINVIGIDTDRENVFANFTLDNSGTVTADGNAVATVFIHGSRNDTIINDGLISSGGNLAVDTGLGSDLVTNRGRIATATSSGTAIHLAGSGTVSLDGAGAQVTGKIIANGSGIRVLNLNPGAGNTYAQDGAFAGFNQTVIASGTVRLSDSNPVTGATTVRAGATLLVENLNGSATGDSSVLVEAGATLTGSGIITTPSGIQVRGHLAPGLNGSGNLTLGGAGAIDLSHATLDFTLDHLVASTLTLSGITSLTLADTTLSLGILGGLAVGDYQLIYGDAAFFTETQLANLRLGGDALNYAADYQLTLSANAAGLQLSVAAVPEPATWAMLGLGALLLTATRRRR